MFSLISGQAELLGMDEHQFTYYYKLSKQDKISGINTTGVDFLRGQSSKTLQTFLIWDQLKQIGENLRVKG